MNTLALILRLLKPLLRCTSASNIVFTRRCTSASNIVITRRCTSCIVFMVVWYLELALRAFRGPTNYYHSDYYYDDEYYYYG